MKTVEITQEPVELYKILKIGDIVTSGGEAKHFIAEGMVSLNGTIETRKRKKVFAGDIITFGAEKICIALNKTTKQ